MLDQIARQLQHGELVERHVAVEGVDHPLPVGPHLPLVVEVDAVGVGVAGIVEPVPGPLFAPFEPGQQPVDEPFVGIGRGVGDKGLHDGRLRQQAGEVEGHAAGEGAAVGLPSGGQPSGFQAGEHKAVDRVANPRLIGHGRQLGPLRRNK